MQEQLEHPGAHGAYARRAVAAVRAHEVTLEDAVLHLAAADLLQVQVELQPVQRLVPEVLPVALLARVDLARELPLQLLRLGDLRQALDDGALVRHLEAQLVVARGVDGVEVEQHGPAPLRTRVTA